MSDATESAPNQRLFNWVYIILQVLGGQIGLPILLVTFTLSRTVRRQLVVSSFCFTWIISSVSFSLSMYATLLGYRPVSSGMCLGQAVLVEASIAMTSTSTLSLALNLWLVIVDPRKFSSLKWQILLCAPSYMTFLILAIVAFWKGARPLTGQSNSAVSAAFYCIIIGEGGVDKANISSKDAFPILFDVYVFSAIFLGSTFIFEGLVLYELFQRKRNHEPFLGDTFMRVGLFSLYRLIPFIMQPFEMKNAEAVLFPGFGRPTPNAVYAEAFELIQAAIPLIAFCILGSKSDILAAWGLRREKGTTQGFATVVQPLDSPTRSSDIEGKITEMDSVDPQASNF